MQKMFLIVPLLFLSGCESLMVAKPAPQPPPVKPVPAPVEVPPVNPVGHHYYYEPSESTAERKALLAILKQLQQLDGLIAAGAANQNLDQRIKFRYDWLRQDVYKISRGISDHLASPESQPRIFDAIDGDYRR